MAGHLNLEEMMANEKNNPKSEQAMPVRPITSVSSETRIRTIAQIAGEIEEMNESKWRLANNDQIFPKKWKPDQLVPLTEYARLVGLLREARELVDESQPLNSLVVVYNQGYGGMSWGISVFWVRAGLPAKYLLSICRDHAKASSALDNKTFVFTQEMVQKIAEPYLGLVKLYEIDVSRDDPRCFKNATDAYNFKAQANKTTLPQTAVANTPLLDEFNPMIPPNNDFDPTDDPTE